MWRRNYQVIRICSLIPLSNCRRLAYPTGAPITAASNHRHYDQLYHYIFGKLSHHTLPNISTKRKAGRVSQNSMTQVEPKGSSSEVASSWSHSQSSTFQPPEGVSERQDVLQQSKGEDHVVTRRHRLSQRFYPKDCPPLKVRWFYAVDSPKRKPAFSDHERKATKPLPLPKKFVPFSIKDSQSIETAFQRLSETEDEHEQTQYKHPTRGVQSEPVKVPVNEDYLFDVNVEERELAPTYWEGPVYEVRRGTWFYQEGSSFKPCSETLSTQLEEGYVKLKPWRFNDGDRSSARHPAYPTNDDHIAPNIKASSITDSAVLSSMEPRTSRGHTENHGGPIGPLPNNESSPKSPNYRLFGAYMNNIVTYQNSSTALITSDDFMSRVSTTVYQTLGGIAGTKVFRGFTEAKKQKENPDAKSSSDRKPQDSFSASEKSSTFPHNHEIEYLQQGPSDDTVPNSEKVPEKNPRSTLERQMSSLAGEPLDAAELEEQARRQEEKEMEDSREIENEDRERTIDHLILVTHGIGQRLGLRLESINFIHDVNVLRKTMKSVYKVSPDLQALNSAFPDHDQNCRVQVLPVCWRHLLDFPYRGVRQNRKELDLADAIGPEDDIYPGLNDITLDSVPAVRNLISDLAMDVLLYQSAYCEHIASIVQQECNRILRLFKQRNPSFRGSVSLCGHSLGSAILFDILCRQPDEVKPPEQKVGIQTGTTPRPREEYPLDFDCEELICLGSPIALFQMLKGKTIAGRDTLGAQGKNSLDIENNTPPRALHSNTGSELNERSTIVSSPKCQQLYNIFHPSDPVSYRIEPLISPAMSALKPQPLPSVKKSLWTASGQSLSIISSRVGQSVGSLWSNFTSGVASSLLNRSLGLNSEGMPAPAPNSDVQPQGAQTSPADFSSSGTQAEGRPRTLIEPNLETLYDGFQKARDDQTSSKSSIGDNNSEYPDIEERVKKLKVEDDKVRALNANGRVDFSVQEGAFDISLIASIASHLTYWGDEDVNHFILSQVLSRKGRY